MRLSRKRIWGEPKNRPGTKSIGMNWFGEDEQNPMGEKKMEKLMTRRKRGKPFDEKESENVLLNEKGVGR
ncbi:hypothetical protein [Bifidobacterium aemilianum]|uniref:hypothetical protein n=1 Tax=Bifidobacterium aemilianum TaxID=2493120 RepID=UPI000FDDF5D0|nr:hypothetical protein [Bifidobacterium aemilianum]